MMELRPYQEDMVATTMAAIPLKKFILLQGATGCGKTIYFCELSKRLLTQWPQLRIAIVAHRGLLVEQAMKKMLSVWPDAKIGIASAGVMKTIDTDCQITIGTIQTLAGRAEKTAPFDIIFVDEAHRMPPMNEKSQYQEFIHKMFRFNQETRLIGLTATPYRLGHGYIYGEVKKPDRDNWFNALDYRVGIHDLQKLGFLCQYRAKEAKNISSDLNTITVKGDYQISELSDLMSQEIHVGSAVKAVEEHARERKRIVVFCVTIEHAETVCNAFQAAGHISAVIHSGQPAAMREMTLREFESGRIRVLVNVMVLSEGFDSPAIDCVVLCRPTKSPALFCQMVGRGLRPHPDKIDVLILDLSNNCSTHGDPDSPIVLIPGRSKKSEPCQKACPTCLELVHNNTKVCPACGYQWPVEIIHNNSQQNLEDVNWLKKEGPKPFLIKVDDSYIEEMVSKSGNNMLKVQLFSGILRVNEFMLFDESAHPYARGKAMMLWSKLTGSAPPKSVSEAMDRAIEFYDAIPRHVEVIEDGKFLKVFNWEPRQSEIDKFNSSRWEESEKIKCQYCGSERAFLKDGTPPHGYKAICGECGSFIKWMPKDYNGKLIETIKEEIPF